MFLKVTSTNVTDFALGQSFKIDFKICDDQPIAFKQDTGIVIVRDRGTFFSREYDLTSIFRISFAYPEVCSSTKYWLTDEQDRRAVRSFSKVKIEDQKIKIAFQVNQDFVFFAQVMFLESKKYAHQKFQVIANRRPFFEKQQQLKLQSIIVEIEKGKVYKPGENLFNYRSVRAIEPDN